MNLLLDTHAVIWALADDPGLHPDARTAIVSPDNRVFVSAASVWEIAIKRALGKIRVPDDVNEQIESHQFEPLPMTADHAWVAGNLPPHHADPFDRMLIAQAKLDDLILVTRDSAFDRYAISTITA